MMEDERALERQRRREAQQQQAADLQAQIQQKALRKRKARERQEFSVSFTTGSQKHDRPTVSSRHLTRC